MILATAKCSAKNGLEPNCTTNTLVARDWRGLVVFTTLRKVDTNTLVQAEAKAILWAVKLASQENFGNVIFDGNSKSFIEELRELQLLGELKTLLLV